MWPEHKKIVTDLLNCRTAHLGGRIERCDTCGTLRITYNSCRNRHCPTCQHIPRERWVAKRKNEILPVHYFHVVFTLPHELNPIIMNNKKVMLNHLFAAASQTLLRFGSNELSAKPGFLAILHTWDQKLNAHFHLHCLIAGGAVADDGEHWVECSKNYLFNQRALSLVFRGKFMQLLSQSLRNDVLKIESDRWLAVPLRSEREYYPHIPQPRARAREAASYNLQYENTNAKSASFIHRNR